LESEPTAQGRHCCLSASRQTIRSAWGAGRTRTVQTTPGAEFHRSLEIPHAALIVRKGTDRAIDSYSAFYENDRKTPTGLVGYLRERGLSRIFLAGLALDFCVRYSAEDARREGFTVFVVDDACRGIDMQGSVAATRASFTTHGISCSPSRA
jgi:nicotinamidase/pyrazinamidase